jgi:uncharacterized protein (TIGR00266 family)
MAAQYSVSLTGRVVAGFEREAVAAALAARFKLDAARAAALLGGKPTVVKKGVEEAAARQLVLVLAGIGAEAAVNAAAPAPAPAATVARAPVPAAPSAAPATPPAAAGGELSLQPVPETPPEAAPAPAAVASAPAMIAEPEPPPAADAGTGQQPGLKFTISGAPDYAFVTVKIPSGQTLKVEASAMATMDTHLVMKTRLRGGFGRFVTGESLFINEFTAQGGPGEIGIAPGAPGDLRHIYLDGNTLFLQNSAYVASSSEVTVESKWQGLVKGFFSGENLFLIRCQGKGDLWFSSYGGIIDIDVDGDYVVDTGNIVAFTDGLTYKVSKVGGYKSLFFSGEGFVCRFSGKGRVWIQTRKVGTLAAWVWPFRPGK